MFDRFFTSKLGLSALVSTAAMIILNLMVATHHLDPAQPPAPMIGPLAELA